MFIKFLLASVFMVRNMIEFTDPFNMTPNATCGMYFPVSKMDGNTRIPAQETIIYILDKIRQRQIQIQKWPKQPVLLRISEPT
jgi:hypothetical protein